MSVAGYQVVYLTDDDDLADLGDDPCFNMPAPTWGICRPDLRSRLQPGQVVVFIAYHRPTKTYFARRLFKVSQLIAHTEAPRRFPGRQNVLLSAKLPGPDAEWTGRWRHIILVPYE